MCGDDDGAAAPEAERQRRPADDVAAMWTRTELRRYRPRRTTTWINNEGTGRRGSVEWES